MVVKFYTINCPKCNVLKKKLEAKHIEYEEIDASEDNVKEELSKKGFNSSPLLEVDGTIYEFGSAVKFVNTYRG